MNDKVSKSTAINEIHDQALIQTFENSIGKKVLILSPSFPFLFIGMIQDVQEDLVLLDVDTTQYQQLENRLWYVHLHQIEVFYIEEENSPAIPSLNEM